MKFYDLFSGIGGFRLGLERNGHECIGSCEIDKYARQVYEHRFGDSAGGIDNDARELDASSLKIDILCAGFPCQAFSYCGQRMGFADARGTLFLEIARIAKQARPQYLFLENVKGLLNHDKGRTFGTILNTLYELGYDVEWQVINGKYFVPQNRERVFIIGHLREKPSRQIFPLRELDESNDESRTEKQRQGKRIRGTYSTAIDYSYYKGWGGNRTLIMLADYGSSRYRVYDKKGIAPTILIPGGGLFQPKILEDNNKIRKLTPLECERLMGFPDNWTQIPNISDTQRYKMIGNSVIVPVIEYIGQHLKNI